MYVHIPHLCLLDFMRMVKYIFFLLMIEFLDAKIRDFIMYFNILVDSPSIPHYSLNFNVLQVFCAPFHIYSYINELNGNTKFYGLGCQGWFPGY